jgi:cell division protein ZapA (FtsZ GTPase activity inhibitor)
MDTLIPINIVIGDRSYRIKVSPEHEEHVRKTVKIINDKVLEFRTNFAGKDMQDYVSMVLIWYATEVTAGNKSGTEASDLAIHEAALQKLELQIDQLLQQG